MTGAAWKFWMNHRYHREMFNMDESIEFVLIKTVLCSNISNCITVDCTGESSFTYKPIVLSSSVHIKWRIAHYNQFDCVLFLHSTVVFLNRSCDMRQTDEITCLRQRQIYTLYSSALTWVSHPERFVMGVSLISPPIKRRAGTFNNVIIKLSGKVSAGQRN